MLFAFAVVGEVPFPRLLDIFSVLRVGRRLLSVSHFGYGSFFFLSLSTFLLGLEKQVSHIENDWSTLENIVINQHTFQLALCLQNAIFSRL